MTQFRSNQLFNNPRTREEQYFNKLVLAGFNPMRQFMEVSNLAEDLTEEDLSIVCDTLEEGLKTWLRWLKHLKSHQQPPYLD